VQELPKYHGFPPCREGFRLDHTTSFNYSIE
jgi:hypothetical protein